MPKRIQFVPGEYYHCYNRGCNKEPIFRCEENYRYLLEIVTRVLSRSSIATIAYCFMPTHYHFLFRQDGEYSLSEALHQIFNQYTKAFNV